MIGNETIDILKSVSSDYVKDILASDMFSKTETKSTVSESFDSIYKAAIGLVDSTNSYIETAQQAEVDFALGNLTSAHELGVVQQKANLALQYTVAVRDKLLEVYKEIMNMQV